jgi:hypothetical protein
MQETAQFPSWEGLWVDLVSAGFQADSKTVFHIFRKIEIIILISYTGRIDELSA